MASNAYHAWVKDGKPYADCEPIKDAAAILRTYGYTVWTKGDDAHMRREPPEDHTAFSATGWPTKSAYGKGHAFDVKDQAKPYPLWQVAEQIIKDKDAKVVGTEWIKYLNYTDKAGNCWHVSWQPNKSKTTSTDKGHLHVSARSDMDSKSTTYDPIKRLQEADMPSAQELVDASVIPNPKWRADAATRKNVPWKEAVKEAWTAANDAAVRSQNTLVIVEDLKKQLAAGDIAPAELDAIKAQVEDLGVAVNAKIDTLVAVVTTLSFVLENLTLRATSASAPGE